MYVHVCACLLSRRSCFSCVNTNQAVFGGCFISFSSCLYGLYIHFHVQDLLQAPVVNYITGKAHATPHHPQVTERDHSADAVDRQVTANGKD